MRNRIWHRHNRMEPEHTFLITVYNSSPIRFAAPILVLHVVLPVAVGFPDIDLDA